MHRLTVFISAASTTTTATATITAVATATAAAGTICCNRRRRRFQTVHEETMKEGIPIARGMLMVITH